MKLDEGITMGLNGITYIFASAQENQTLQIIEFILAIITSITLLAYRLWKWWKEAKKDGKITKEEIKDGIKIAGEGVSEIKNHIDKFKQEGDKTDGENQ